MIVRVYCSIIHPDAAKTNGGRRKQQKKKIEENTTPFILFSFCPSLCTELHSDDIYRG